MPPDRYGSIPSSTIGTIGRRTNDSSDSNLPNGSTNSLDLQPNGHLAEAKYDLSTENTTTGVAEIAAMNGLNDIAHSSDEEMDVPHPINPMGLYLLSDPKRGRGVFTKSHIPAGTSLEESPVLVMSKEEWEEGKMNDTILGEYGFCWANRGMAIGLGLASLFNHSSSPNVNFIRNTKAKTISFRTVKNVNAGDELCICYAADESKLWFVDTTQSKQIINDRNESNEMSPEMETFPLVEPDDLYDAAELATRREHRESRLKNDVHIRDMRLFVAPDEEPFATQPAMRLGESQLGKPPVVSTRPFTPEPEDTVIHSPRPVRFQGYPSPPYHENLPDVVSDGPLPPPLHSTPTPSPNTPPDLGVAELVEELDWRAEDWSKKNMEESDADDNCVRIKGPAEIEDDELFHDGLMDVWVVDVWEPQLTKEVLAFSKEMGFTEQAMKHLKRVTRQPKPDGGGEYTCIALCSYHRYNGEQLIKLMSCFHPTLADLIPRLQSVPKTVARNAEEARVKNLIWPVNLSPLQHKPASSSHWTPARRAWVNAGIQRILSLALEAKQRGEVPVGVFCASAPEMFWPSHDGFIAPTPDLRAQSTDTRISACHPLRHAVLNCVRAIAHLRTVPPFSTLIPTRNGADYLLTSLTLFITHEPCSMCCMALLHSRVREVFYIFPRKRGGGFEEGGLGIHGRKDLNHRFEVWKYTGEIDQATRQALEIDDGIAV